MPRTAVSPPLFFRGPGGIGGGGEEESDSNRNEFLREYEQLKIAEQQLLEEKNRLAAEWLKIEKAHRKLEAHREAFEKEVESKFSFMDPHEQIEINVGGKVFIVPSGVLSRDRFSLLSLLCTKDCPIKKDTSGKYFFDRDWYIFQFIIDFLQDRALPDSMETLRELYYEASFYRMGLLRHAIERRLIDLGKGRPSDFNYFDSAPPADKETQQHAQSRGSKSQPPRNNEKDTNGEGVGRGTQQNDKGRKT